MRSTRSRRTRLPGVILSGACEARAVEGRACPSVILSGACEARAVEGRALPGVILSGAKPRSRRTPASTCHPERSVRSTRSRRTASVPCVILSGACTARAVEGRAQCSPVILSGACAARAVEGRAVPHVPSWRSVRSTRSRRSFMALRPSTTSLRDSAQDDTSVLRLRAFGAPLSMSLPRFCGQWVRRHAVVLRLHRTKKADR